MEVKPKEVKFVRRVSDEPNQRNLASIRTILESLVVIGVAWLVATSNQQTKDLVAIKVSNEYIAKMADKVPNLEIRLNSAEQQIVRDEKRISDLETLEKAR